MATKPTNLAEWATGAAPIVEPSLPQKQAGWPVDYKPPAQWFNWWMKLLHQWVLWLNDYENEEHVWTALQTFGLAEVSTELLMAPGSSLGIQGDMQVSAGTDALFARTIATDISNPTVAALERTTTIVGDNAFLIFEQLAPSGMKIRIYAMANYGIGITYNARYAVASPNWTKDTPGAKATLHTFGYNGLICHNSPAGLDIWDDGDWVERFTTANTGLAGTTQGLLAGEVWSGDSSGSGVVVASTVVAQPAWTLLTLSGNMTAVVGDEPGYYQDTTGRIWLRGVATSNAVIISGSQIATQPAGLLVERPMVIPQIIVAATPNMQLVFQASNRIDLQVGAPGNIGAGVPINFANISYRPV